MDGGGDDEIRNAVSGVFPMSRKNALRSGMFTQPVPRNAVEFALTKSGLVYCQRVLWLFKKVVPSPECEECLTLSRNARKTPAGTLSMNSASSSMSSRGADNTMGNEQHRDGGWTDKCREN